VARPISTCSPHELIGAIKERIAGSPLCAVVDTDNIVLGLLDGNAWDASPESRAEDVMSLAPVTFRPDRGINDVKDYFSKHHIQESLITTSDGRLIGLALGPDIEGIAEKPEQAA